MFPMPRLLARAGDPLPWDPRMGTAMPSPVTARRSPDASAAALAALDPGADAFAALEALPATGLSDSGLLDALAASEKLLAALAGKQQEFLAEIARRDPDHDRFLRDEAAFALHQSGNAAEGRLADAEQLAGRLSDALDLVRAGQLPLLNARILAQAVQWQTDEVAVQVQDRVLPRGCWQTPGEFRAAVRRAIARADRAGEEKRHENEVRARRVEHFPDADGMADVWLRLGADGAAIVMTAVNAWATKQQPDDDRGIDQRRADAIVEICQAALSMPGLPARHGARPSLNITLAASTLAGLDDLPGELAGYGPIPADMARRWAADPTATFRYWPIDAAGRVLDRCVPAGPPPPSDGYTPSASLARHVITRDQVCTAPGCRRQAAHCDLDHRVPWPEGPTSAENLHALCRRHHRMKHQPGWKITKRPDGVHEWTSPSRHHYRYRPPEHPAPEPPPSPPASSADDPPPF